MLRERVLVALVLLPVGLVFVFWGGWALAALVALLLSLAAREYAALFRGLQRRPALPLLWLATVGFPLARVGGSAPQEGLLVAGYTLATALWHLLDYERGAPESGTDFGVTLAGGMYLGYLGSYFVALRQAPFGLWWLLLALPTIWIADSGAYFVGKAWGRHRLSPRLSPKKTWEGYGGGVVTGTLGSLLLAQAWNALGGPIPGMGPGHAALLGLTVSALAPLGDLAESMFKRQAGQKDSGALLPGHGGAFDRIDSWLWAAPLAYGLLSLWHLL